MDYKCSGPDIWGGLESRTASTWFAFLQSFLCFSFIDERIKTTNPD